MPASTHSERVRDALKEYEEEGEYREDKLDEQGKRLKRD